MLLNDTRSGIKANKAMACKQKGTKEYHENLCHSLLSQYIGSPCQWDREANEIVQLSGTSNEKSSEGIFLPSSLFLVFLHTGNVILSFLVVWKCKCKLHWYSANLFCVPSNNCRKFYKFLNKTDNSWWVTYYYLACVNWMIERETLMELLLILHLCLSHPITSLRFLLYKWNLNFICYGLDTEHVLPQWKILFCFHTLIILK